MGQVLNARLSQVLLPQLDLVIILGIGVRAQVDRGNGLVHWIRSEWQADWSSLVMQTTIQLG